MCVCVCVLIELGPNQKLEETQASSLKCLGQPAHISLDSAVLAAVRPVDIHRDASAAGGVDGVNWKLSPKKVRTERKGVPPPTPFQNTLWNLVTGRCQANR